MYEHDECSDIIDFTDIDIMKFDLIVLMFFMARRLMKHKYRSLLTIRQQT